MKTKAILSAAAWCLLTLAQAQEGTTPVPANKAAVTPDAQVPAQKSAYHECFVTAGPSTWKALGLDDQQATRVADLQSRYKAEMNPPKEEKKGKATAPKATTAPVDKTGTVEAVAPDAMEMPQFASVDDELRSILTPQQLTLWEKKCSHIEPIGVVTP
ncbi:MAG: hypothetical protein ABI432_07070 [Flavobacteriales bacterium]